MKWRPEWVSEWDYVSKNLKYIKFEKIKNKKGYFAKKKKFRKKMCSNQCFGPYLFLMSQ